MRPKEDYKRLISWWLFVPQIFEMPLTGGWFSRDAQILQRIGAVLLSKSKSQRAQFQQIIIAKDAFALGDRDAADKLLKVWDLQPASRSYHRSFSCCVEAREKMAATEYCKKRTSWGFLGSSRPSIVINIRKLVIRNKINDVKLVRIVTTFDRLFRPAKASLKRPLGKSGKKILVARRQASAAFRSGFKLSGLFRYSFVACSKIVFARASSQHLLSIFQDWSDDALDSVSCLNVAIRKYFLIHALSLCHYASQCFIEV